MAVFSIVAVMAAKFISKGLRVSSETSELVKLQSHYIHTMIFIERNIEDKSGVTEIVGKSGSEGLFENCIDKKSRIYLKRVRFEFGEELKMELGEREDVRGFGLYVVERNGSKSLKYDKSFQKLQGEMECGSHIGEVALEPIPDGASFREAVGIRFVFENRVGSRTAEFEKTVYFKNRRTGDEV